MRVAERLDLGGLGMIGPEEGERDLHSSELDLAVRVTQAQGLDRHLLEVITDRRHAVLEVEDQDQIPCFT